MIFGAAVLLFGFSMELTKSLKFSEKISTLHGCGKAELDFGECWNLDSLNWNSHYTKIVTKSGTRNPKTRGGITQPKPKDGYPNQTRNPTFKRFMLTKPENSGEGNLNGNEISRANARELSKKIQPETREKTPTFLVPKPDPNPRNGTQTQPESDFCYPNPSIVMYSGFQYPPKPEENPTFLVPEPNPNPIFATRTHHYFKEGDALELRDEVHSMVRFNNCNRSCCF